MVSFIDGVIDPRTISRGNPFLQAEQIGPVGSGPSLLDGRTNPLTLPARTTTARTTPPPLGPTAPPAGPGPGETVVRQSIPYPTSLPPLSAEMLAALEARRAASLRQLQETEAQGASLRQRAQLENVGRLLGIEDEAARERRSGLADLASRSLARSPMFANPFRRELARQQQQQIGQSEQELVRTLDQLGAALEAARQRRESELSQIAFDEAQARSDVNRLLGVR